MQLLEVTNPSLAKEFIQVSVDLYKKDPNWIRPLDKDINEVFDKKKNKAFRFGNVIRWILKSDDGKRIGRIAAFVNKKYRNKGDEVPVGGIGFFECINSQEAADLLFDCSKHWLIQQGMEAMDGPINFGERDRWWGLVTHGFDPPLYCMNYNPPYYVTLFETYGFKLFFNQVCFGIQAQDPLEQKVWDRYTMIDNMGGFRTATIEKNKLEKYAADFTTVYNKAWAGHGGLKELSKEQVLIMFKKMKPVMDEDLVFFAYYKDDPVAIFVNMPDLNQWFRHLQGKFSLYHKLKFLWYKKFGKNDKFVGLVFGIVPEWQGKGVDAYMVGESAKVIQKPTFPRYEKYEMQWIGDFNPKMLNVAEQIGKTFKSRNLVTFRYLFDQTREFKRHPILN